MQDGYVAAVSHDMSTTAPLRSCNASSISSSKLSIIPIINKNTCNQFSTKFCYVTGLVIIYKGDAEEFGDNI